MDEKRGTAEKPTPPCEIRIDKEGVWYYRGAEMFRKDIVQLFYQNLHRDHDGRYLIELDNDRCYLEVEDTPFVVRGVNRVDEGQEEAIHLDLIDGTIEALEPSTLRIGADNVLYCSVKKGAFDARFSRAGYYQIADYIDYDSKKDHFFIKLNGQKYPIQGQSQ